MGLSAADNVMSGFTGAKLYTRRKTDKTQFHQSQTLFCLVEAFSDGEEMKCGGMRRDKDRRGEGVETGEGRCKILPFFILCVVERIAEVRARHFDG